MPKQPPQLPDAESDEAATPSASDVERADALAASDPILGALWNASTYDEDAPE